MNKLKTFASYFFCLMFVALCSFGVFAKDIFSIGSSELAFYIQISSFFVFAVFLLLIWYYSLAIVNEKTYLYLLRFITATASLDINKFSTEDMNIFTKFVLENIQKVQKSRMCFYIYCIPFLTLFLTICVIVAVVGSFMLISILISAVFSMIFVDLFDKIIDQNTIWKNKGIIEYFPNIVLGASRGIQFYHSESFVEEKFCALHGEVENGIYVRCKKYIFVALLYFACLFCCICVLFFLKEDYVRLSLFDVHKNPELFYSAIFFFILANIAYVKSKETKELNIEEIFGENMNFTREMLCENRMVDRLNMFVVFHKISFQEPTKVTANPLIENLSLSILPKEFVVITGEQRYISIYLYDLLLKYYKVQSGDIYVGGVNINNISLSSLRSSIGIFVQDFGIIVGSIFDNLLLASNREKSVLEVAKKVGLEEVLQEQVFGQNGKMQVSQEVLLRIQIARVFLNKHVMLLVEAPESFESEEAESLFYNFVKNIAKKKTIMISTNNLSFLIYSNKILYFGEDRCLFGTHADLSFDVAYQDYLRKNS